MTGWMMSGLLAWLAGQVVDLLGALVELFTIGVFTSPDVTVLPQVQALAGKSALVVNAAFVLAIITAAIVVMTSSTIESRYTVKELIPRLVVGWVMSNMALPICAALIEIANSLVVAMVGTTKAPATEVINMVKAHLTASSDQANALLILAICVVIAVLLVMFLFSYLVRISLLVILAGVAPVALACYALPYTQPAASLWWRSMLGSLSTAVLQGICFNSGLQLLLDPQSSLPVLIGVPGSDVVNLLLVLVILWTTVKVPGLMRKYVTGKGGANMGGVLVRAVLIQAVTRKIPLGRVARGGR